MYSIFYINIRVLGLEKYFFLILRIRMSIIVLCSCGYEKLYNIKGNTRTVSFCLPNMNAIASQIKREKEDDEEMIYLVRYRINKQSGRENSHEFFFISENIPRFYRGGLDDFG